MGWVDWLLRPFRGQPEAAEGREEAPTSADPAPDDPHDKVAQAARNVQDPPIPDATAGAAEATGAAANAAAPPPKKQRKRNRKRRKRAAPADNAPEPRSEVLSVAEAERRYGAMVEERALPSGEDPEAPAPVSGALAPPAGPDPEPSEPPPLPTAPTAPTAQREVDPAVAARKAEAAENRRRAQVPQYEALLSRTSALLAVEATELRHLTSARRELVRGWARLGRPPADRIEALTAAYDAAVAALEERIEAGAAAAKAREQENNAKRWAVVVEARALAEREDLKGAGPEMGALRARLRAVGRARPDDEAVVAFAAAEATLKQRQEDARATRDAHRREQLERLDQLVRQAEALAKAADPEAAAERAKALQATWKTIRVPGPRTEANAAWARFRAACDAVFEARSAARVEASRAVLDRLEAIVAGVEHLAEEGTDGDPDDDIAKAMAAWKRAGRAPRAPQQVLWERMQRAFDRLRAPPADLSEQDQGALQFRPFEGLVPEGEGEQPQPEEGVVDR